MNVATKDRNWYAVYTAPRAEKAVSERLTEAGIAHYLALHKVKHQWSDRIKEVSVPVINGYVFVYIPENEFSKVMRVYGAISFLKSGGVPVAIPDKQIETFRFMVENTDEAIEYSTDQPSQGQTVSICKGPLEGLMGELVDYNGKYKVLVRLERFGCALTTVPLSFIKKIN
jgi:transcription antitermination factor NusG